MAYVQIQESEVPAHVRFDVAPQHRGQIVETAESTNADIRRRNGKGEIRILSTYHRVHDRSDNTTTWWRLEGKDIEVDLICKAFGHERNRRKHALLVNDVTGDVLVHDDVSGHYTRVHSLSARDLTRARKAASPVAL